MIGVKSNEAFSVLSPSCGRVDRPGGAWFYFRPSITEERLTRRDRVSELESPTNVINRSSPKEDLGGEVKNRCLFVYSTLCRRRSRAIVMPAVTFRLFSCFSYLGRTAGKTYAELIEKKRKNKKKRFRSVRPDVRPSPPLPRADRGVCSVFFKRQEATCCWSEKSRFQYRRLVAGRRF